MQPGRNPKGATPRSPGTRAVHAGHPPAADGQPLLPGPELASTYHLAGASDASRYGYARYANRSAVQLEVALGELEGGSALTFASGMAATAAVLLGLRAPRVAVIAADGYPGVRQIAADRLPGAVEVRLTASRTAEVVAAAPGADLIWIETPSNPRLDVVDIPAVAEAAHRAGARLAVDNTLATPLGQRPLELGADLSVVSATKSVGGHSDLLLGYVATADEELAAALRAWRDQTGAIASPFEAWLTHRSLATLDLRLERSSANAAAVAALLAARPEVSDLCHPGEDPVARRQMRRFGPLVGFALRDAGHAQRFLAGCELVAEATSFGGVHSTAERRARWGTDAVPEGFIRFSAGCEDPGDLLADVEQALDAAAA